MVQRRKFSKEFNAPRQSAAEGLLPKISLCMLHWLNSDSFRKPLTLVVLLD
jgi:hypothetical protein